LRRAFVHLLLMMFLAVSARHCLADERHDMLLQAQEQFQKSNYDQALETYRKLKDTGKGDPATDYNMALCHLKLGGREKALELFEAVGSSLEGAKSIRKNALYNAGVVRAENARRQLQQALAPQSQPADQEKARAHVSVETLRTIADELLKAIQTLRRAEDFGQDKDIQHNIQAGRILRRNVLGMLQKALEKEQKKDIYEDPQKHLQLLIGEQKKQAGIGRFLAMVPPEKMSDNRKARRAAVRAQRELMERAGSFADHLANFSESVKDASAQSPTQNQPPNPAQSSTDQETVREKLYHAVGKALQKAIDRQRDACAFYLDGELSSAGENQHKAVTAMVAANRLFPLDPEKALPRAYTIQARLKKLVDNIESANQWLADPHLSETFPEEDTDWPAEQTALYYEQKELGDTLVQLAEQCQHIATTSQPADPAGQAQAREKPPAMDPELNRRLAEILDIAAGPQEDCLQAIAARDQSATANAQQQILDIIRQAINELPKSIQQRLAELIRRQTQLNEQVKAHANPGKDENAAAVESFLGKARKLAGDLMEKVFRKKPADLAKSFNNWQKQIHADTLAVRRELQEKIPTGQTQQQPSNPGEQKQLQAFIEADKHLDKADFEMQAALEGLEQARIKNSLKPMEKEGPVQTAQGNAREELVAALQALQPPDKKQKKKDQQKDKQKKQQAGASPRASAAGTPTRKSQKQATA